MKYVFSNLWMGLLFVAMSISSTGMAQTDDFPVEVKPLEASDLSKPKSIRFEMPETETADDIANEIQKRVSDHKASLTIVTTDSPEILEKISKIEGPNMAVMPYGDLATPESQSKFRQLLGAPAKLGGKMVQSIKDDKWGFVVVTFVSGLDIVNWIHAGYLTDFQRYGNATYSFLMYLAFRINKDAWSYSTDPIRETIKGLLGLKGKVYPEYSAQNVALKLVSSFTLASALNFARTPLLPMDRLVDSTLALNIVTMPLLFTLVETMTSFGWSENLRMIDQKKQPISKFIFRRASEARALLLGAVATTAILLDPATHGFLPWITVMASGGVGWGLYLNNQAITNLIDRNKALGSLRDWYSKFRGLNRCEGVYSFGS